jgi:hypothetical protein
MALLAFIVVIKHIESKLCPFYVSMEQIDIHQRNIICVLIKLCRCGYFYSSLFQIYVNHHRFIRPYKQLQKHVASFLCVQNMT